LRLVVGGNTNHNGCIRQQQPWCCRLKARRWQGQGALPMTHGRRRGDIYGFRILGYFTPPFLCYDHRVYFNVKYSLTLLFMLF